LLALYAPALSAQERRAYAFAAPPLTICDRLPELKLGDATPLADSERRVLAKVWELRSSSPGSVKLDPPLLLDALLVASGIVDDAAQAKYRARFDSLLVKARDAVKDAKDDRDKGERLMQFLHREVMPKKYSADQTLFSAVFDTGKFNCVSSTAMYYAFGSQLGLDLRPFSIPSKGLPGHASLDVVIDGQRLQVEPTNPDGFDWQAKINRPGVTVVGYIPDRKDGYEVDAAGVAAMIYSNRGVTLTKANPPRNLEASRCYLAALALDPGDPTATQNLTAVFTNWGLTLAKAKKFEDAVRVIAFGQSIAPKVDSIETNAKFVWSEFIKATIEAGKDKEAIAIIARAAQAVPSYEEFRTPRLWFTQFGDTCLKDGKWEDALAIVPRALAVLPEAEAKAMHAWRSHAYRIWSQRLLEQGEADGSMDVLTRAYAHDAKDQEIHDGLLVHTVKALERLDAKSGRAAALAHFQTLRQRFPDVDKVRQAGAAHAQKSVSALANKQRFQDAINSIEGYLPFCPAKAEQDELYFAAYDPWGRHLAKSKQWKEALAKYAEGVKASSGNEKLHTNGVYTANQWAQPALKAQRWSEALQVINTGLEYFPNDQHLSQLKQQVEKRK
jgi:tetratricopeptide (TPR) repeat protein